MGDTIYGDEIEGDLNEFGDQNHQNNDNDINNATSSSRLDQIDASGGEACIMSQSQFVEELKSEKGQTTNIPIGLLKF